ncbi:PAS domain-containing sensor histidine kinase [Pseudolabrys sp. Root1462]|uniref:sensor histidine kinase NtrY-like n=1 Tax=Pseudolabrys sp. Root1462 TaxID=1736466 RepID=UPI000702685E|nr:PAS domain-containing sensor histidine kinase [Pseudolabrys sp. Root1462]KQZ01046.1 PAS domain-containing sensor histidine kinase [Pseudolabrys sp. Root1462]
MSLDQATSAELSGVPTPTKREGARVVGPIAVGLALLSAFVTFVVLADLTPIAPTHYVVVSLLLANATTVVLLLGIIVREVWQVVQARRSGRAAARLHVRIVGLFSIIAAAPAILVAIVASVTLDRGLDRLFSTRTRAAIENSLIVAEAYLRDHAQIVRSDILVMAFDLSRSKPVIEENPEQLKQFLTFQAAVRGLATAIVFDGDLKEVARADTRVNQTFALPPREALPTISDKEPQLVLLPDTNYVAAMIKLQNYDNRYLYVTRLLDPRVVPQLRETRASVSEYVAIEQRRFGVQVAFGLMYTVIALIVLLSAVWLGFNFANKLVAPIRRLIGAANAVSEGNLYVRVPVRQSEGDLAHLGETFNRMTQELRTQRDDLVRARDVIDTRRIFTEAVLAGASAGVIGVDSFGNVSILNRSAEKLIGFSEAEAIGKPLIEVFPELSGIMLTAKHGGRTQDQVTINRAGRERNLSVRVTSERSGASDHGYVITLDDITELVTAQRSSAWADIARRIAHEIKNPLTPIQLSAERLRRKYGKVIVEDRAVFEQCTDTIIRQVDDIRQMVDEFSKFARMPKPVIAGEDIADTVRQAVFLQRVGNPDLDISAEIAEEPMPAQFDRRLISQALTNIIKNATEAVAAVPAEELGKGIIRVFAAREGDDVVIDIVDNGIGLPRENRNRLMEPYVTTREKGTGLGLAIVGRILEEHGGGLELRDASDKIPGQRGAWMRMRFAAAGKPAVRAASETETTAVAVAEKTTNE